MTRDPRVIPFLRDLEARKLNRRRLLQASAATAAAVAAPVAATSRGARTAVAQSDPTQLVVVDDLPAQWFYLDPARIYEVNSQVGMQLVYECLYHIPDATKLDDVVPLLAEDFPTYSEDGLTATIKLKPGVTFHNSGNEVTADDWVWSWNRLKNVLGNPSYLFTDFFESVTAVDPQTLELKLVSPNVVLPAVLSTTVFSVTDSTVGQENGGSAEEGADATDMLTDWLNLGQSIGTGPYMLTFWDPNGEIVIEKNPTYWGDEPSFERIIFRNVAGAASQMQLVELGEADIAVVIDPDQFEEIANNPGLQILEGPSLALDFLAMHTSEEVGGPLASREARQAIAHAIDYDGIIDGLSGGMAVRPAAPVPLGLLGAEEVEPLKYVTDIDRANELWEASGNGPTEITFTYDANGISVTGVSTDVLAAKFQEDVERIEGVTVTLNPMDAAQRLTDFRESKLQFTYSGWAPDFADVHSYAEPFGREGSVAARRVAFANDEIGPLLDQGIVETDPEKRREIYTRIQEIMVEEAAFISIVQPTYAMPATVSLVGAQPHGTYLLQLRYASKEG